MSKHSVYLKQDGEKALEELRWLMRAHSLPGMDTSDSAIFQAALIKLADDLSKK